MPRRHPGHILSFSWCGYMVAEAGSDSLTQQGCGSSQKARWKSTGGRNVPCFLPSSKLPGLNPVLTNTPVQNKGGSGLHRKGEYPPPRPVTFRGELTSISFQPDWWLRPGGGQPGDAGFLPCQNSAPGHRQSGEPAGCSLRPPPQFIGELRLFLPGNYLQPATCEGAKTAHLASLKPSGEPVRAAGDFSVKALEDLGRRWSSPSGAGAGSTGRGRAAGGGPGPGHLRTAPALRRWGESMG